jgi:hypothetical protein
MARINTLIAIKIWGFTGLVSFKHSSFDKFVMMCSLLVKSCLPNWQYDKNNPVHFLVSGVTNEV